MHMQVNPIHMRVIGDIFLEKVHHLLSDTEFAVWFKHAECEDVRVGSLFEVLNSYGVGSNYDVVVKGESGMLCVLDHDFHV